MMSPVSYPEIVVRETDLKNSFSKEKVLCSIGDCWWSGGGKPLAGRRFPGLGLQWWWLMVLPVILVTFSLVLAIFHLCGIWLENATTTPPWKLHCHLHHHHLSRDHYHHYHLMSRMSLKLKYFWNAYNWVLICILESHHYQWSDRKVITDNLSREAWLTRPLS